MSLATKDSYKIPNLPPLIFSDQVDLLLLPISQFLVDLENILREMKISMAITNHLKTKVKEQYLASSDALGLSLFLKITL